MTDPRGANIEIIERRKKPEPGAKDWGIVVPNEVRINGQLIAMPQGQPVIVHDLSRDDVAMVTLTVFARRIFVGHEDVDRSIVDAVASATAALTEAERGAADAQSQAVAAIAQARDELARAHQCLAEATRD